MDKTCTKCSEAKDISEFSFEKSKNDYNLQCKDCIRIIKKRYEEKVKIKRKEKREAKAKLTSKECTFCNKVKDFSEFYSFKDKKNGKKYYNSRCIICSQVAAKEFYENNKIEINKDTYQRRKDDLEYQTYIENYNDKNEGKIKKRKKKYYKENKEKISTQRKTPESKEKAAKTAKISRDKIKKDPTLGPLHKLRRNVSHSILKALKAKNGSKRGYSILEYLPYTIEELKAHIESLWEPWMNWKNHGSANSNKKTWQIDHIIPQSLLPYDSMDHPNFLKCWELSNLRPLDAIENMIKGNRIISEAA